MSGSFQMLPRHRSLKRDSQRFVAVTGAAGRIGREFSAFARQRYRLRLLIHPDADDGSLQGLGEIHRGEITDDSFLREALRDVDTLLHLAADPSPQAEWASLLHNNIRGTYSVFGAAREAHCRRVVYASSIHAVSGYAADHQVRPDEPVNPGDLYGVTKCFGEALGRWHATQHGLSCIAVRIGAFQPTDVAEQEESIGMMNAFISHRDLNQLLDLCVRDEALLFAIVNGLSGNRFNRLDLQEARELLGYDPQDDFTELNSALAQLRLRDRVLPHNDTGANAA